MRVNDLERLYDYSCWANRRLFHVMSQLTPEQFTQSVAGSYESIRNTLVHVLSAEWGWLDRCGGHARGERLRAENYPTLEAVINEWGRVELHMRQFLAQLSDDDLARDIEFAFPGIPQQPLPVADLLTHAMVHAAHHRGQIALLLRQLGIAPGNFDLLIYSAEQASAPAKRDSQSVTNLVSPVSG